MKARKNEVGQAEATKARPVPLQITEIFHSLQGESTHAGKPCIFVRLTGCSLRCGYCDTKYSYFGGRTMTVDEVLASVASYPARLVEITGGEPLEQEGAVALMERLIGEGYTVMLETGGHVTLDPVPEEVIKIVDVKCPGSGEGGTFRMENLEQVQPRDEFKFVISSRDDYEWSIRFYRQHLASREQTVLFSPVHDVAEAVELAQWILADGIDVRLQLQIHKYIWGPEARGI